jgi:hypothetical protein
MPDHIASRTYGTVSDDRQKEMSGLEFVRWDAASQYDRPDHGL